VPRLALGRAVAIAEPTLHHLRTSPSVFWAEPAGALRRGEELVEDIDLIVATADAATVLDGLESSADRVVRREAERLTVVIEGARVGVQCRRPEAAGALLLMMTGSDEHVDELQRLADVRRLALDLEGLRSADNQRLVASTEAEIYAALGLPFIPPELRNDGLEIRLAITDGLPSLVSRADIRGDLHMHTHWSDGRDSVEAMVTACAALDYEYLAITDHSPSSAASRNLAVDDVQRQAEEIATLRERYPQISILHGVEVDILPDGRLDFPDRILSQLDIVLASLHDRAGHSPDRLLQRYEAAMTHPLVSIVTHPMNRSGPGTRGYDLDVDRVFELAARTGTVLEVDGAPSHLDLEAPLARRAVQAGVTLALDGDSHRAALLERHMSLSLLTARRGWVQPGNVLNTKSHAELTAFLARKRRS
jgi:DNA polymerase (family X)